MVFADASGVDNALEHGALGIGDSPVKYRQAPSLGMMTKPEGLANGTQIF